MKRCLILPLLALLPAFQASTQDEAGWPWYFQFNGHLQGGFPIEAFADEQPKDGLGFGGQMLFQLRSGKPVFAGLEASMLYLGREKLSFTAIEDGQPVDYRLVSKSNIFMLLF